MKKGLVFLILFITISYFSYNFYRRSRASMVNMINTQSITEESYIQEGEKTSNFSLHKNEGFIYKSKNQGEAAVLEFLNSNPQYQINEEPTSQKIKGASSGRLIPKNFIQNSFLARLFRDREDKFLTTHRFYLNGEHYFYHQKINNIPVFAGILAIHLRNGNEIYSIDGNLVFDETFDAEKISEEQAKEIALKKAREEAFSNINFKIEKAEKYILNLKILGLSSDETNYLTLAVTINSDTKPIFFSKQYFVDLNKGKIVFSQNLIQEALNRNIYNCNNNYAYPGCPKVRSEGATDYGDPDVDKAYTFLGDTYNYYKNSFGRDSYDDQGGPINVYVRTPTFNNFKCPNSAWSGNDGDIIFCEGLIANDVLMHEYTHILTYSTVNLIYQAQSGALNESISDIFSYALDPDDWTIGEDTILGAIRRLDNPTQSRQPQPDRLFSPRYYCDGLPNSCDSSTNDNCGVHFNNGVINKAFYLMTAGGSFNGCNILGIGREKTLPIVYRALTTYLTPQSNFKGMYNNLLKACNDLYQANSNECLQVKAALQATEIDQQPENTQVGAGCPGSGVTRQTPQCVTLQPSPTLSPPPQPSNTPTPTATLTPPERSTPSAGVSLYLTIKFQGILEHPPIHQPNSLLVKVTLITPKGERVSKESEFFVYDVGEGKRGFWSGNVDFNVLPGSGYTILIKGPKHIQKKICDQKPQETYPGSYHCGDGKIELKQGVNNLDFSGIYQLVGDLPDQDGIVNAYDVSLIRNCLNQTTSDCLKLADLNLDGVVNAQDYSLVIAALSVRTDEE